MENDIKAEKFLTDIIQTVRELDRNVDALIIQSESCGVPSPKHEAWHSLLKQKLMPQLAENPFVIAAVTGGTNTGKSLIFNHLAGEHFSGVDYRASGTKHPVCLIPVGQSESILRRQFDTFEVVRWENPEQTLEESNSDFLFLAERKNVPQNLIILDTPDIDSAAKMNWKRAEKIRTAADVIVAVLTQEKYNDAAVRRFYREAAAAKKPVIVLFNMLDLDEDVQHIPRWIEQFITETKVQPLCILAVPHSRTQAENLTLPFHEVLIQDDKQTATLIGQVNFNTFLSELKFNDIKTQTLLGALDVLNDQSAGISAYLARIETAAKQFAEAQETLKHNGETTVEWAFLPSSILAEEIRLWWSESRPDWSKTLNSFYRKSGQILLFPIKKVGGYISTEYLGRKPVSPVSFTDFEKIEREAAVELCENMFQKLERLAASYNPVLKRELSKLLTGEHRVAILETAHKVLSSLEPVNDDFRVLLRKRLDDWKSENPQTDVWLRRIDNVMSAAHPLLTGVLVLGGSAVVGLPVFGSMIAGGVITTYGGETLLAAGSEGIAGGIAKLFRKIQKDFVTQRCQRFCAEFNKEIWDDVNNRLKNGTEIVNSEAFQNCKKNISALRK